MATFIQNTVKFLFPILGLLLLVILLGGFLTVEQGRDEVSPPTPLTILNGMTFLVASEEGDWYNVQKQTSDGFVAILSEFDGTVVDYARQGDVEVLIRDVDGVHHVFYREKEGEWRSVSESPFEKATVELSSDGTLLSFSERVETEINSTDFGAWQIVIHSLETADTTVIPGYAPQFVTITEGWTLVYFSSASGAAVYEPISENIMYAEDIVPPSTQLPIQISSDGTALIAYNEVTRNFTVFTIQDPTSIGLSALGSIPPYNDIYIKDGILLGLDVREVESFVWVHALDNVDMGDLKYTFPSSITPSAFLSLP